MQFHRVSVILVAFIAMSGMVAGVGAATTGDSSKESETNTTVFEDFPKNGSAEVATTATGHGEAVTETITFGDRDAHNVEINATVRDGNDDGERETLPGATNVAAGTNLTVATGHGDEVKEVAITYENDANATVAAPSHDERHP